jgi:hypothetical protein
MSFILTLIMAFTIGFTGASTQAHTEAPTQAPSQGVTQAPSQAQCEEDEACWDCATMGNKQCSQAPSVVDAWATVDAVGITAPDSPEEYVLSYKETVETQPHALPMGSFALQSYTSTAWHVFQWDILKRA